MRQASVISRHAVIKHFTAGPPLQQQRNLLVPVPVCYANVITRGLEALGHDCSSLLDHSGVSAADLERQDARVSVMQQLQIITNALRISGDPGLGLCIGSLAPLSTHGAVAHAAISSTTVGAAMEVVCRYHRTRGGFFALVLRTVDDGMLVELNETVDLSSARRCLHEAVMLTLQAMLDATVGVRHDGARIVFAYPAPPDSPRFAEHFHVPVYFGAPRTALWISRSLARERCITADATSCRNATRQCEQELAALDPTGCFVSQVQSLIGVSLGVDCTAASIAAQCGCSTRSMNRRLADEGTSYRALLDEARRQRAHHELRASRLSINDISSRLGYQDPSNFGRAARAWFGVSPSRYRELHEDAVAPADAA
jgi:AraC-like DNA-binding protein